VAGDRSSVLVLTYHSVSSEAGPTSTPVETFAMQMATLAACGYATLTIDQFLAWRRNPASTPGRRALISFDDGFADFAGTAFPILQQHGFASVVFLPTDRLGGREDWRGANQPPRRLMGWDQVKELADAGVEFGSHTLTHPDLTKLDPEARRREIKVSAEVLANALGRPVRSFAPPYGHVDQAVLADVAATYEVAFGTRFGLAEKTCDPVDVPRIEMHYFREARRWRDFLEGGSAYFAVRKGLRAARGTIMRLRGRDAAYD
jgi:peptidoglycan/xylan/chitin deacetylase (PgdA/CDA1 family)